MEFIQVEELMKAGKEVNDLVREWWKPSKGDLFTELLEEGLQRKACILCNENLDKANNGKNNVYPLLTVGQLIDFIEWRTDYAIEKITYGIDCYWVYPYFDDLNYVDAPRWFSNEMSFSNEKLIQALWKCACEVARDSYYNK